MSDVLVTGGAGFIGSHLVDRLVKEGHKVDVYDNMSTGSFTNCNDNAFCNPIDIFKKKDLKNAEYKNYDVIFHLAAQINLRDSFKNPWKDARINIMGSLNIIELAKRHGAKLVFASTGGAIYSPEQRIPWSEHSLVKPQSPYGLTKFTVENYLSILNENHCILRLSNVYGPRQNPKGEAGVISIFIDKAMGNEDLLIFGNGGQTRDFIYVDDVVDAFVRAGFSDMSGIYNVSFCENYSINEIAKIIIDETQADVSIKHEKEVPGELRHSCLTNDKLMATGWKPKVSLEEGIRRTIKYFADI